MASILRYWRPRLYSLIVFYDQSLLSMSIICRTFRLIFPFCRVVHVCIFESTAVDIDMETEGAF